ncbi:DUF4383 domain-containing protein [Candidatus Woesearchaeota archaeon]|nr:DUF4383 domain-containing protein [Candidatus Woesearchaeota archaeon]
MRLELQKWYTRTIGIFFVLVVITLINDYLKFGHRPETWHKVFHVLLGVIILYYGWSNKNFWKPFCLANGAFFTYIAIFGFVFPDFGGLDAFNRLDTLLHGIVGLSGLSIGLIYKN